MLEIPPPLSFGRVGRLYNTTLLKNYTTIYDPICHRDIRPLELKCETPALAALKPSRTICVVAIGSCASPGSLSSTMYMVLSAQKLLLGPFEA